MMKARAEGDCFLLFLIHYLKTKHSNRVLKLLHNFRTTESRKRARATARLSDSYSSLPVF